MERLRTCHVLTHQVLVITAASLVGAQLDLVTLAGALCLLLCPLVAAGGSPCFGGDEEGMVVTQCHQSWGV